MSRSGATGAAAGAETCRTPHPHAVWLYRTVRAAQADNGLLAKDPGPSVPGSVVVSVDGSDKGGIKFVSAGLRLRWSALGHSQYGCYPMGIAKIKEKDKEMRHLPLCVFLRTLGCDPVDFCGRPGVALHTHGTALVGLGRYKRK